LATKTKKIDNSTSHLIAWDKIGKAINKIPLSQRWFLTKHTSGMCGVGKFTTIWKKTETAACPRCGNFEDAPHVWSCNSKAAQLIWDSQLDKLHAWLATIDTDPEIITTITTRLKNWYYNSTTNSTDISSAINDCIKSQEQIGWGGVY
jgi:hypothetical protein